MTTDPNHWTHKLLGGRFGEMLPHPVYVLQSFLGDKLHVKKVFVSKRGSIPWLPNDELLVTLESERGFGSLYVSFNGPRMSRTIDVYGTKKILKINLTRQMVLQLGSMGVSKFSVAKDCLSEACKLSVMTTKNALQYSFRKPGDNIVLFYSMLVDSIRSRHEPLVTPEMAYNTVRIVEEICQDIAQARKE
jgi:predicted dehydrogenase